MNALVSGSWVEAAGWTLIHSLWQSTAIALLAAAVVKAGGSRNARLNYAVYCIALLAAVACSAGTFAWLITRSLEAPALIDAGFAAAPGEALAVNPPGTPIQPVSGQFSIDQAMPVLVGAWVVGVMLMSVRLVAGSLWLRRLRRSAAIWDNPVWQEKFKKWSEELGIRAAARLCTTTLSEVPSVIGHLKPVVLLPASLIGRLIPEELEAVILHELMHIRRNDFLVNLLQSCCETLFFFNPAVWWLSRSIRTEREHVCDELVAERSGDKVAYAKALVRLEELRLAPSPALALGANGSSLKQRISRLLGTKHTRFAPPAWSGAAVLLILFGATLVLGWPRSIAQEEKRADFELRSVVESGTRGAEKLMLTRRGEDPTVIWVSKQVLMDKKHFASVEVKDDPLSKLPQIWVRLTEQGAKLFGDITEQHVGKQIAIVIDGKVVSAPRVNERITGGSFVISGNFTKEEADAIAEKLRPKAEKNNDTTSEAIKSAGWIPAPNAIPSVVLKEAQAAQQAGQHEEALARYVWYHTASRHERGQGGVRLSFAMSYWRNLGRVYPPALAMMKKIRDETGEALRTRDPDRAVEEFTLFQEYAAFNETLGDSKRTSELFLWLDANDPKIARQVYRVAQPALLEAGEIDLSAKYADPDEFKRMLLIFKQPREHISPAGLDVETMRMGEKRFLNQTATLIALLMRKGDKTSANEIATKAIGAWNDPTMRAAVDNALKGILPGGTQILPTASTGEGAAKGANATTSSGADDTAEERALLQKEIDLTRREIGQLERARDNGRISWEELADHQRQVMRLEYELAWLNKDNDGMINALQREISLLEAKIKIQNKKVDAGAVSSESLIPMERDLLRAQRELAATRKGRPPQPARAAP